MVHELQGRIAVKVRRPTFGPRAPDFGFVLLRLPMVGDVGQVRGDFQARAAQSFGEAAGQLRLQGPVDPRLQLPQLERRRPAGSGGGAPG